MDEIDGQARKVRWNREKERVQTKTRHHVLIVDKLGEAEQIGRFDLNLFHFSSPQTMFHSHNAFALSLLFNSNLCTSK